MLSTLFGINTLRSLAMRTSNDGLRMVDCLIHIEILNYEYFSSMSIRAIHLICCAGAPECLRHKILISNFGNQLIHRIPIYSRSC